MTGASSNYNQLADNTFLPKPAKIVAIEDMTSTDRYFRVELQEPLGHRPDVLFAVGLDVVRPALLAVRRENRGSGRKRERAEQTRGPPS